MITTDTLTATRRSRFAPLAALLASPRAWALMVFGVALVVRLAYALVAPRIDPFLVSDPLLGDARSYDRIARSLLAGGAYETTPGHASAFWPPLYPFMLTGIYAVFGYNLMAARLVQALLGALLPPLLFLAAGRLGWRGPGRWASLGAAVYPYLVYFGAWLIAEALFFALSGLMLWCGALLQRRPSTARAAGLGLVIGLAALAKPTVLFQLPFLALWFLTSLEAPTIRRRFVLGLVTALAFAATLSPWLIRNYLVLDHVVLISTNGGYTFYGANNAAAFGGHFEHFPPRDFSLNEAVEQQQFYRQGMQWIRENPQRFAWLTGQKLLRLASPLSVASSPEDYRVPGAWLIYGGYGLFLLLALLGAVASWRQWRSLALFYVPVLGVLLSSVIFYGDARYTLPAVPSLLLFAAIGLRACAARFARRFT